MRATDLLETELRGVDLLDIVLLETHLLGIDLEATDSLTGRLLASALPTAGFLRPDLSSSRLLRNGLLSTERPGSRPSSGRLLVLHLPSPGFLGSERRSLPPNLLARSLPALASRTGPWRLSGCSELSGCYGQSGRSELLSTGLLSTGLLTTRLLATRLLADRLPHRWHELRLRLVVPGSALRAGVTGLLSDWQSSRRRWLVAWHGSERRRRWDPVRRRSGRQPHRAARVRRRGALLARLLLDRVRSRRASDH